MVAAFLVNNPAAGWVESVFTVATHLLLPAAFSDARARGLPISDPPRLPECVFRRRPVNNAGLSLCCWFLWCLAQMRFGRYPMVAVCSLATAIIPYDYSFGPIGLDLGPR
jgi:hypothetical protein